MPESFEMRPSLRVSSSISELEAEIRDSVMCTGDGARTSTAEADKNVQLVCPATDISPSEDYPKCAGKRYRKEYKPIACGTATDATLFRMGLLQRVQIAAVRCESLWFDFRWGVLTHADTKSVLQSGDENHYAYLPTRPSVGWEILRNLPIESHSDYTFVDYGSGLGRMLLLAAQLPFAAVHGVEYDLKLHERAVANIQLVKKSKRLQSPISCFHLDASQYQLPESKLVLYFFNPFSSAVFQAVLELLRKSLEHHPRKLFIVTLYPETRSLCEIVPQLKVLRNEDRMCLYGS